MLKGGSFMLETPQITQKIVRFYRTVKSTVKHLLGIKTKEKY